jgi:hypothetical protein
MVLTRKELKRIFGTFSYKDDPHKRGAVIIEPAWVQDNIVYIGIRLANSITGEAVRRLNSYDDVAFGQPGSQSLICSSF